MNILTQRVGLIFLISMAVWGKNLAMGTPQRDTSYWKSQTQSGIFFSQQSYSDYFKGGGTSSVALGGSLDHQARYANKKHHWDNRLKLRYGLVKVAGLPVMKNDDHMEIDSKYGFQFSPHLKCTGLFNFQTRMHDMYEISKAGERGKRIANFLAPAFINLGSGLDYVTKDSWLSLYYSPVNSKITLVTDQNLLGQYLPGLEHGKVSRYELGSLFRLEIRREIMTNIFLHTTGTFFTNHLQNFGAIDVNIENKLNFKINKLFSVNLLTQIIYDEDILFDIPTGEGELISTYRAPRTQFREILNIGLTHSFNYSPNQGKAKQ